MKLFYFLNMLFVVNSFKFNSFKNNYNCNSKLYALKNYNEKPLENMDIFDKFEKYSFERNKEKQAEYLYKIKKHLDRKYEKKTWEKNLKNN